MVLRTSDMAITLLIACSGPAVCVIKVRARAETSQPSWILSCRVLGGAGDQRENFSEVKSSQSFQSGITSRLPPTPPRSCRCLVVLNPYSKKTKSHSAQDIASPSDQTLPSSLSGYLTNLYVSNTASSLSSGSLFFTPCSPMQPSL